MISIAFRVLPMAALTALVTLAGCGEPDFSDAEKAVIASLSLASLPPLPPNPDGVRFNEGGALLRGRAAIARDVAEFVGQVGPVRVTIETAGVWLVDDVAWESGAWSYTFQPKGKAEQRLGGRYVTLWRRQADGGWRIWRDLGVSGT